MTISKQFGKTQNVGARCLRESSHKAAEFGASRQILVSFRRQLPESCVLRRRKARTGPRLGIGWQWNFVTREAPRRFTKFFRATAGLSVKRREPRSPSK